MKKTDGWHALILSILKQCGALTRGDLMLTLGMAADGRKYGSRNREAYIKDLRSDRRAIENALRVMRSKGIVSITHSGLITATGRKG